MSEPSVQDGFLYELKVVRERRAEYNLQALRASADVWATFRSHFEQIDREEFVLLLLDNKHRILGFHVVSIGSLTSSIVHPREVLKAVVLSNAAAFVAMHNHPSGDPTPSREDLEITRRLKQVAELIGVRMLDHIVFGDGRFVSFVDGGYF